MKTLEQQTHCLDLADLTRFNKRDSVKSVPHPVECISQCLRISNLRLNFAPHRDGLRHQIVLELGFWFLSCRASSASAQGTSGNHRPFAFFRFGHLGSISLIPFHMHLSRMQGSLNPLGGRRINTQQTGVRHKTSV